MDAQRSSLPSRPLRVLGYVAYAWPRQKGGSETALHRTLAWLATQGHEVRCLVTQHSGSLLDGVQYAKRDIHGKHEWWQWADVVVTQQAATENAVRFGVEFDKPVAHYVHNWHFMAAHPEIRAADLLIWNSDALAAAQSHLHAGPSIVLHPPVDPQQWRAAGDGELVTQINLSRLKGGPLFWNVAALCPDIEFLAVIGGWGEQVDANGNEWPPFQAFGPTRAAAPPNVTVAAATSNMAVDVYRRTRLLMIPTGRISTSQNGESYGLVAAEATCAGIPVLAVDSPGIAEALGSNAVWCHPEDPVDWAAQIRRLADPDEWEAAHQAALTQAARLDPTIELQVFEQALSDLACVSA